MVNYRKILQLDADKNVSVRDLLSSAHCSYHSYTSTIEAAKAKGITWPLDNDVTNEELQEFLFPGKYKSLSIYQMPNYAYIHKELARNGVNLTLLHEEYTNSRDFNGTLSDAECMKLVGIARNTFYRYKKQLKNE